MRTNLIYTASFLGGFSIMAAEMSAGRMMAPFFGTSTLVWALVIGTVMFSLAIGGLLGGWLTRRKKRSNPLPMLLFLAGFSLALIPAIGQPLMVGSLELMRKGSVTNLLASGVVVVSLLMVPMAILGAINPVLLHLFVQDRKEETGVLAGRLYALATAGSLLGTFLPGIVLVPLVGSGRTMWIGASLLVSLALFCVLRGFVRSIAVAPAILVSTIAILLPHTPLVVRPGIIHSEESALSHITVTENKGVRRLYLGDGFAVQSIHPVDGSLPLKDVWGQYALAPAWTTTGQPQRVLLLGLGGGTSARIFHELYPEVQITGVEIDPAVVEAGRKYFSLPKNIEVVIDDARAHLLRDPHYYDVIIVDAFQFPYVPFQLTTQEFMIQLADHLTPGGTILMNVGRDGDESAVVDAIAKTMGTVFPHVRAAEVRNASNTMLIASFHAPEDCVGLRGLQVARETKNRLARLPQPRPYEPDPASLILMDDRAPVELITDGIIIRRLLRSAS